MEDRRRNEAAIAERVRELAQSYCIQVEQVSYNPVTNPLNQETELTVCFDVGNSKRPREVKIPVKDVDDYQSGSDARMRVDRKIESVLGTIDSRSS